MNRHIGLSIFLVLCVLACAFAGPTPNGKARRLKSKTPVFSGKSSKDSSSTDPKDNEVQFDTTRALIKTAKALARSHSTSEVLTLNLTNLLILIVLKAIIFGIGLFYFGGVSFKGGHDGWGRSLDIKKDPLLSQSELLLMMTYVLGSTTDNYDCMYRVACEDPTKANDYLNASNMLLKGAKYAKKFLSYNPKYEDVVRGLHDAVAHRKNGGDCRARYICSDVPNL